MNACDVFADRLRVFPREVEDLRSVGFHAEELDLRAYFDRARDMASRLARYDLVWVVGGNAFVLARAMNASGFGRAARELLASGSLVYAGYSAGACVTGPDLAGIDLMDHPDSLPDGYDSSMSTATLAWLPWRVVPHWRSDHPESAGADAAVRHLEAAGLEFRAVSDGDVIVVEQ